MFVVCFGDGLGNQMFQYAFYLALKKHYIHNDVKMDIFRVYGKHIHNGFELDRIFRIEKDECSSRMAYALAEKLPSSSISHIMRNFLYSIRRLMIGYKDCYISQDDPTEYYDEVFHLSEIKHYMLCGNWVNPRYFDMIREQIISSFTFPEIEEEWNIEYMEKIQNSNSVSVHIRKGDYKEYGFYDLTVEYYKSAIQIIEKENNNLHYFIFTNDKDNISEYLSLFNNYTVIEGNKNENSYRDMQLMSLCKHNIIAHSTFSFWGAYLNQNTSKIVIAPKYVRCNFKNSFACDDWIIIENEKKL